MFMSNEAVLKDINIVREYTIFKFNQLDRFCWNIVSLKEIIQKTANFL